MDLDRAGPRRNCAITILLRRMSNSPSVWRSLWKTKATCSTRWTFCPRSRWIRATSTRAADSLNRAFALPGIKDEKLFYGYMDRSDIYRKIAETNSQRDFDVGLQAVDRMRENLTEALAIAQKLGWSGLAKRMQDMLKNADLRAKLIGLEKRSRPSSI